MYALMQNAVLKTNHKYMILNIDFTKIKGRWLLPFLDLIDGRRAPLICQEKYLIGKIYGFFFSE